MKVAHPSYHFCVYPDKRSKFYFGVNIWDRLVDMRRFLGSKTVLGQCAGWRVERLAGERWKKTPELGRIDLCRDALGVSVVCHEFTHAALRWGEAAKLSLNPDPTTGGTCF